MPIFSRKSLFLWWPMQKKTNWKLLVQIGFFSILLSLYSCAAPRPVPEQKERPALSIPDLEKKVHTLINQERQKQGLSALAWNSTLSKIARKHSQDMAKKNYFSHVSPEGHDFSYRYRQEGFSCAVPVKDLIYTGAENIFQNNLYDRVAYRDGIPKYDWNSSGKLAESTVRGWMNSPGHRKNILTPHWRSEGIGIYVSPDDKVYITQNFC